MTIDKFFEHYMKENYPKAGKFRRWFEKRRMMLWLKIPSGKGKETNMNYWIISDTHFNHVKLEEWGGRSGNWQFQIWDGLNNIPKEDTLIHLGDICIGDDLSIHETIALLKCKKILVRGNHDKKSVNWYLEHGWDFVVDGMELIFHGHYIYFSHRPIPPVYHFTQNIHGHTHGNLHRSEEYCDYYNKEFHKDISPEIVGFKPLRLDVFVNTFKSKGDKIPPIEEGLKALATLNSNV